MKNMQELTERNQVGANQQQQQQVPVGQFATMPGMMGMPQANQFMTGMPFQGMSMQPTGFGAPSLNAYNTAMPGMGQFGGGPQQFMGGPMQGFGGAPSGFNTNSFAANPMGGQPFGTNMNTMGPGPSIESFQKDGFKILGREPVKVKNDEGQKEFAELFSLADTKIKDRAHEKPKYDLTYNPLAGQEQPKPTTNFSPPQQQPLYMPPVQQQPPQQQQQAQISDAFANMNIGSGNAYQQQQNNSNPFDDIFGGGGFSVPQEQKPQAFNQQQPVNNEDLFSLF